MGILDQLSSAVGDRTEASNKAVASEALDCPEILEEVALGLNSDDRKLVADCAEVFTEVAKVEPALVAPYADRLVPLIGHKDTRVRWESTHALALIAGLVPEQIAPLLPTGGRSPGLPPAQRGPDHLGRQTRQTSPGRHEQAAGHRPDARTRSPGHRPKLPGPQASQRAAAGERAGPDVDASAPL